jgi:hypothetical protein
MKLIPRIPLSTRTDRLFITEPFQIVHEFVPSAVRNIKWRYREFDPASMGQAQWLIQADYVAVNGSYGPGNRDLNVTLSGREKRLMDYASCAG